MHLFDNLIKFLDGWVIYSIIYTTLKNLLKKRPFFTHQKRTSGLFFPFIGILQAIAEEPIGCTAFNEFCSI